MFGQLTICSSTTLLAAGALVPPVLAAGIGSAISVLFLIIAFLSWLWNVVNGNQNVPPGQGRGKQPPPAGRKVEQQLQAEINKFLKNVMGKEDDAHVEVIDEEAEEVRRPKPKQKRRPDRQAKSRDAVPPVLEDSTQQGPRPGGRISSRKGPGSTTLGSSLQKHVQDHMQEGRVTRQAREHMAHGVAEKVEQDLGQFTTAPLSGSLQRTSSAAVIFEEAPTATATGIAQILRNPSTMKQAFVMHLILARPKFGRDRHR